MIFNSNNNILLPGVVVVDAPVVVPFVVLGSDVVVPRNNIGMNIN